MRRSVSHELAGPDMTFGWLHASFKAIDELNKPENLDSIRDIPTLILSTPIDPIVDPASHHAICGELNGCDEVVEFESNFATGPVYFHELLVEVDRASVIAEIRAFLGY